MTRTGADDTPRHPAARTRAWSSLLALALAVALVERAAAGEPVRASDDPALLVHGTMDAPVVEPILAGFRAEHPNVRVRYRELNSIDLYTEFLRAASAGEPTADVVMSSAIDLQAKLVNDGYARMHRTPHARFLPSWAIWRDEAFAFSFEPVVTVYNSEHLPPEARPSSRYRLVELLRGDSERFTRRIGTYDPARSGTGYLYLTQDMEQSPIVWELIRTLGQLGVQQFATSREIIDRVVSGELLVGYNVVGSYAFARAKSEPSLAVVLPEDYTLVVSRTAFISRHGLHRRDAARFLDYLLSRDGQNVLAYVAGLFPSRVDVDASHSTLAFDRETFGSVRAVRMSPGLLVYVDRLKREKVLRRWRDAIHGGARNP